MKALSVLALCVVILLPALVKAQSYIEFISRQLAEAEDYLAVNPARSLELLDAIGPLQQPEELSIRWHLLVMRSALPTNQLDKMQLSLQQIFSYQQHPLFVDNLASINSAAGIWLRRNRYVADAKTSLQCAMKYAKNTAQRLTLLNSMGLVSRELDDYATASSQFHQARTLASAAGNTRVLAMVENNLGLLAMEQTNYAEAALRLRSALTHYQSLNLRSGQISSALNLMLVFLLQGDIEQFQRLLGPTSTMTQHFPNQAKHALLVWLHAYFQHLAPAQEVMVSQAELQAAFTQLDSPQQQRLIQQKFAVALNVPVELPATTLKTQFNQPWFSAIKNCSWPAAAAQSDGLIGAQSDGKNDGH